MFVVEDKSFDSSVLNLKACHDEMNKVKGLADRDNPCFFLGTMTRGKLMVKLMVHREKKT